MTFFIKVFVAVVFVPFVAHACFDSNQENEYKLKTGSTFYMECRCDKPTTSRILLKWYDVNDQEIIPSGPGTKSNVYTEWWDEVTFSLYITNVSKSISGTYKCLTDHNGAVYYHKYTIEAYDPPYFVDTKEAQYIVDGEDALVSCEARGETDPLVSWLKDGAELIEITDDKKYEISTLGLLIRNVSHEDAGIYKCTANDLETGEEVTVDIKVEVITKPVIEELVAIPDNVVYEGGSVALDCTAEGILPPKFTWRKLDLTTLPNSTKPNYEQVVNRIVFDNVTAADRGLYECRATNAAGSDTRRIELKVLVPPEIMEFPNVTALEDGTTQLVCKARGLPPPNIHLLFQDEEFEDHSIVWDSKHINGTATEFYLTFLRVSRSHAGYYICNATNDAGSAIAESNVTVLYRPWFSAPTVNAWGWDNHTVSLSCDCDSYPPADITWRYQGSNISTKKQLEISRMIVEQGNTVPIRFDNETMYGIYECVASNLYGEAKKVIVFLEGFPPPSVANVIIQNLTSTSVTFEIVGPEQITGPPVIGFTAEYDKTDNYNVTNIHRNRTWAAQGPFIINKLEPNSSYLIRFAAVNEVGTGVWSHMMEFFTLETSTPEEPTFESDQESLNEGILKWKVDHEEQIDYYYIKYCPVFDLQIQVDLCTVDTVGRTNEISLTKLLPNATYYFELVAHNDLGNSTVASNYITTPAKDVTLSAGAILGITVAIVFLVLLALDLLLLMWRRQGVVASCVNKKTDKKEETVDARDKKGLLGDASDSARPAEAHKHYEYNKTTGVITGKHSAV